MSANIPKVPPPSTAPPSAIADHYFLDARHKVLEIAAFLDRMDRARSCHADSKDPLLSDDFRLAALRESFKVLAGDAPGRARAIQLVFSDLSTEPIQSAAGMKGAVGAWKRD